MNRFRINLRKIISVLFFLFSISATFFLFQNCSGGFKASAESFVTNSSSSAPITGDVLPSDFLSAKPNEGRFLPFNVKTFAPDIFMGGAIQTYAGKVFIYNNERMPTPKEIPELFNARSLVSTYNTSACGITGTSEVTCYAVPAFNGRGGGSFVAEGVTRFQIANVVRIWIEDRIWAYLSNGDLGFVNPQTKAFEKLGNFTNAVDLGFWMNQAGPEVWAQSQAGEIFYMGSNSNLIVPGAPNGTSTFHLVPNLPKAKKFTQGLVYVAPTASEPSGTYQIGIQILGEDGIVFEKNFVTNVTSNPISSSVKKAWLKGPSRPFCYQRLDDSVRCLSYNPYPTLSEILIGTFANITDSVSNYDQGMLLLNDGQLLVTDKSYYLNRFPVSGVLSQVFNSQILPRLTKIKMVTSNGVALIPPYYGKTFCGVSNDGLVYCWGDNSIAQFGHKNFKYTHTPQPIAGISQVKDLFIGGGYHPKIFAQHLNNEVSSWFGQVGGAYRIKDDQGTQNAQVRFIWSVRQESHIVFMNGQKGMMLENYDPTSSFVISTAIQLDTPTTVTPLDSYLAADDANCIRTSSVVAPNTYCVDFTGDGFKTLIPISVLTKKVQLANVYLLDSTLKNCYITQTDELVCNRESLTLAPLSPVTILTGVSDFSSASGQLCALTKTKEVFCMGWNSGGTFGVTSTLLASTLTKINHTLSSSPIGLQVSGDSLYLWSTTQVYRAGIESSIDCTAAEPCRAGLPQP